MTAHNAGGERAAEYNRPAHSSGTGPELRPIVIFSHPRSGTHLTLDFFRRQFEECRTWKRRGEKMNRLYLSLEAVGSTWRAGRMSREQASSLLRRVKRPLIKTHWAFGAGGVAPDQERGSPPTDFADWLRRVASWVYVIRDGRSVMCSYQLFRACFDPSARWPISQFIRQAPGGVSRGSRGGHRDRSRRVIVVVASSHCCRPSLAPLFCIACSG